MTEPEKHMEWIKIRSAVMDKFPGAITRQRSQDECVEVILPLRYSNDEVKTSVEKLLEMYEGAVALPMPLAGIRISIGD